MSDIFENYRKKVVVSVSTMNLNGMIESLRMAIGIATGRTPLEVTVLFNGDGVVNGLANRHVDEFEKYYLASKAHNVKILIDEYCMSLRNIEPSNLIEGIQVVKREEILALLSGADLHVRL